MAEVVRFKRERNRTARDVFDNMIMPKLPLVLNVICQKITHYNKTHHSYTNRTGSLENSISWMPAKQEGDVVKAAVIAGGPTTAQFTYKFSLVFYYDEQHRLRVFEPAVPRVVNKGDSVNVKYAVFVEVHGYPVLKQGIEYFRPQIASMCAQQLKQNNLPRMYTFKYTGVTADIYGNG